MVPLLLTLRLWCQIFLGDEPCCGGLPVTELDQVASFVKTRVSHTSAFIYVNECERTFMGLCDGPGSCKPYPGMMTHVPAAIDVISADIYEINKGWEANAVRKVYEEKVYPALAPHQTVWQVPGLFADSRLGRNVSEKVLLDKLDGFWDWACNDTRVTGINPWHWNTWGSMHTASPQFELGAKEFPTLRKRLEQIGAEIKAGGYGGLGKQLPVGGVRPSKQLPAPFAD